MISTMRPDIDNIDEYVRNTTARYIFWLLFPIGSFKSLQVVTISITIVPEILELATLFAQKSP